VRSIPRWLVFTVILVLLAATGLAGLAVGTIGRSFPDHDAHVTMPGLTGSVEVVRDAYGVPQIYADNAEDLFEAQGYVQAQDRFFEMDVRRHITSGRLSELFGASQVKADIYLRTLGWHRVAEQELPLLAASTRRYLDAYSSGVNAYLRGRSSSELSLEYTLLGLQGLDHHPEDWTAADSVSWLKALAWDLGENLSQESELAIMSARVGAARAAELFPAYPLNGFEPIVTQGSVVGSRFDPHAATGRDRPAPPERRPAVRPARSAPAVEASGPVGSILAPWLTVPTAGGDIGSNSWVVSGRRTASGKPLLSNDPHLTTSIPSTFEQIGLHCRLVNAACPYDVAGYSLAGVPGVVIGHNASIAWGLTTSDVDAEDLYLEDVVGDTVREGSAYVPLNVRTEDLRVRGEDHPRTIRIRSTRHGPLLSDVDSQVAEVGSVYGQPGKPPAVSLNWTALTPGRTMDALLDIDAARNFANFRTAAKLASAPSQNLVYADTAGHIGYQLMGTVPRRGLGDGLTPAPGWDRRYDWLGTVPFEQLPYAYDPPSGYLVAANQEIIGGQYPDHLGSTYSYGWRSQQLRDALVASPALNDDSGADLFYDDTIRFAAELVPVLLRIKVNDPWVRQGQQTLVGWDYRATADSAAAAYFNVVVHDILRRTFADEMPPELSPDGGDRWFAVLTRLLKQPDKLWWDDVTTKGTMERRDDILLAAMTDARKEMTTHVSRDTDGWQWGKLHRITLRNQTLGTSGIGLIERLFNRGDVPAPGGPGVVNALGYDTRAGYAVTEGPSMRMLVDLGNLDASRWINQSGNSGHAFGPNYADQLPLWATNQLLPFSFSRRAVDARTTVRMELVSGG
jgi:penicillin amidase